jgi:hypothetical protein
MADDQWYADETIRLYALTGGRTSFRAGLDMATQVKARPGANTVGLEPEQLRLMALCQQWQSVAEISAFLGIPMLVVKVQVSELIDREAMLVGSTSSRRDGPSKEDMQQVLAALRAL